jgi:hypothetical protein
LGAAGNAVVIGVWAMSRIWGVPVGPGAWEAEPVALADALATGFEAGIVLVSLAVLIRPALAQRDLKPQIGLAGIGTSTLAVAVLSIMAVSPSYVSDHHDGDDAAADGHSHDDAAAMDMTAEEHDAMDAAGSEDAAAHDDHGAPFSITFDGSDLCTRSGFTNEGNSSHGHSGPQPWEEMDVATRDAFGATMAEANAVVAANPTVADAEAHGYTLVTGYVPCIAAHYVNYSAFGNGFVASQPEVILYDGTDPDSHVAGLSYLAFADPADPETPPAGFPGDNDKWHTHASLCFSGGLVVGDESTSDEECAQRGNGRTRDLSDLHMLHLWNAPEYPSYWGIFSGMNPSLGGTFQDVNAAPRLPDPTAAEQNAAGG